MYKRQRYSKRPVGALGDPDRLLPIGSDPSQLAKAAISQTLTIAQEHSSACATPMSKINGNEACAAARPDDASPQRTGATDASSKTAGARHARGELSDTALASVGKLGAGFLVWV